MEQQKEKGGDVTPSKMSTRGGEGGRGGLGPYSQRGVTKIGTREGREWTDRQSPVRKREEVTKSISVLS